MSFRKKDIELLKEEFDKTGCKPADRDNIYKLH